MLRKEKIKAILSSPLRGAAGFLLLLLLANISFANNAQVDSLRNALKTPQQDTNKVNALNLLSRKVGWRVGNLDTALYYADAALKLAKKINYKKGIADANNNCGIINAIKSNYLQALTYFHISLKIRKKIGNKKKIADSYLDIGNIYNAQGNYPKALENFLSCLKIKKEISDKTGIAKVYNNIGITYANLGDDDKALNNFLLSSKIYKRYGYERGLTSSINNIGSIYAQNKKYAKALAYYRQALKLDIKLGDKQGISDSYNNIGTIYARNGNYSKVLPNLLHALKIRKEIGYKNGVAKSYYNIANFKQKLGKINEARIWMKKSLMISKEIGAKNIIRDSYRGLSQADSALGNYKSAYENYKMYIAYRNSIKNKANTKKITQLQMQFKFDQKQAADSIAHAKEKEIQQAKIAKQNAVIKAKQEQQYAMLGSLLLVLVFAGFMYNRFKKTQKQKKIIERQKAETEHQKQLVEIKNKEISDSITYAKRIQEAILPSRFSLSESLRNGFVLFKPKDIVSGDFYWLEKVGNSIFFAAADCTGHGVPGAMVSVVCANALSKALLEENITETGKLLDRVREIVIQQFSHSDENVKDGMDISLCKLEGNKLQWSGANNPLWIINPNRTTWMKEALPFGEGMGGAEIKPNRQSIGKTEKPKPFTTHNIELQKGDSIYIFSDGYADQFGGKDNKKFKYKQLKELLLSLQDKDMDSQKEAIAEAFEQWKGDEDQVDDVCVIGVRF